MKQQAEITAYKTTALIWAAVLPPVECVRIWRSLSGPLYRAPLAHAFNSQCLESAFRVLTMWIPVLAIILTLEYVFFLLRREKSLAEEHSILLKAAVLCAAITLSGSIIFLKFPLGLGIFGFWLLKFSIPTSVFGMIFLAIHQYRSAKLRQGADSRPVLLNAAILCALMPLSIGILITAFALYSPTHLTRLSAIGLGLLSISVPVNVMGMAFLAILRYRIRHDPVALENWTAWIAGTLLLLILNYPVAFVCLMIGTAMVMPPMND